MLHLTDRIHMKLKEKASASTTENNITNIQKELSNHFVYLYGVLQNLQKELEEQLKEVQSPKLYYQSAATKLSSNIQQFKRLIQECVLVKDPSYLDKIDVDEVISVLEEETKKLPCHLIVNEEDTTASCLRFVVDEIFMQTLKCHCAVEGDINFRCNIVSTDELPPNYELEPIEDETDFETLISISSRASSMSALSDCQRPESSTSNHDDKSAKNVDSKHRRGSAELVKGSSDVVTVCHVRDPASFYVHRVVDKPTLDKFSNQLTHHASKFNSPPDEVLINGLYIVQYRLDKKWYRARTRAIVPSPTPGGENMVDVHYIDYGNSEVIPVSLHRVKMVIMEYIPDTYYVDLCQMYGESMDNDVPISVRDALIFLEHASFLESEKLKIPQMEKSSPYFQEHDLKKGTVKDVLISHINTPHSFYVQRVSQACAAQYSLDKRWYRAKVIGLAEHSMVEVFYVDYGNQESLHYTQLRKLLPQYSKFPAQAIHCSLSDVMPKQQTWTPEVIKHMIKVTGGKVLRLYVDDLKGLLHKVILYDSSDDVDICINGLLVREGFATSVGVRLMYELQDFYANTTSHIEKWEIDNKCCAYSIRHKQWFRAIIVELLPENQVKGEIENSSLPVELWVKDIIPGGPFEPSREEWHTINEKLTSQGLAIPVRGDSVENQSIPSLQVLKELDEQSREVNKNSVSEWLQLSSQNGSSVKTGSSDTPVDEHESSVSDIDEAAVEDEAAAIQSISDWIPPLQINKNEFNAVPTYVDDDGYIFLHDYEQLSEKCKVNDNDRTIKVKFVDYGNPEVCKATELRKNIYLTEVPIQCHKCELYGVKPISLIVGGMNLADILVEMQFAVYSHPELNVTPNDDGVLDDESVIIEKEELVTEEEHEIEEVVEENNIVAEVEIMNDDTENKKEQSVSEESVPKTFSSISDEHAPWNDLIDLEEKKTQLSTTIEDFAILGTVLNEMARKQPVIKKPYIGQPCCACYTADENWYRATVTAVEERESKVKVHYVDYGNTEYQPMSKVHILRPEWAEIPALGIVCKLWQIDVPESVDAPKLYERLASCLFQEFPVTVIIKAVNPELEIEVFHEDGTLAWESMIDDGLLCRTTDNSAL
ncbi:hypothetical protein C0J52_15402 [Blattella germanica]|nr:hypothetical protein C0J52_15402 [Blattella germanica]